MTTYIHLLLVVGEEQKRMGGGKKGTRMVKGMVWKPMDKGMGVKKGYGGSRKVKEAMGIP